jgi:AcrR family transcriptional regulator
MVNHKSTALKPRKQPVQERANLTVEAISEATIQVLLSHGTERLTTTRVAEKAGVSVGTLYQYYPNKQSLLYVVLEQHLLHMATAVEAACRESQNKSLREMVNRVVDAFIDAKMRRVDLSLALYAISGELNGPALVQKITKRLNNAFVEMLNTLPGASKVNDVPFVGLMMYSSMGGAAKMVLENGATPQMVQSLRSDLKSMCYGYLQARFIENDSGVKTFRRI